MPLKLLVVDDEKDIVELVRYHAERAGFLCLTAGDGASALRLTRAQHPDVLILDLMLPDLDGLEVCRQLRRERATARLPIVMLTAKAEEVDRVVGLEVGADDYLVKPFSPRELMARVKAILRRAQEPPGVSVKRVGGLEIDEEKHQVVVKGTIVELTAREFGLLRALVWAEGRVLSRERVLEAVWGYANAAEIESRTVDVHIRRLREKLGSEARRIVTVKGVGYRFDCEG